MTLRVFTACPRRSYPFYIVGYYIKWVTTYWTSSTNKDKLAKGPKKLTNKERVRHKQTVKSQTYERTKDGRKSAIEYNYKTLIREDDITS